MLTSSRWKVVLQLGTMLVLSGKAYTYFTHVLPRDCYIHTPVNY
jgi:hypothetical protein